MLELKPGILKLGSSVFVNADIEVSIVTEEGVDRKTLIRMTWNSKEKGHYAQEWKAVIWKRKSISDNIDIIYRDHNGGYTRMCSFHLRLQGVFLQNGI